MLFITLEKKGTAIIVSFVYSILKLGKYYRHLPISLGYSLATAVTITILFTSQDYAEYLINQYEYEFSWYFIISRSLVNYVWWALLTPLVWGIVKPISSSNKRNVLFFVQIIALGILITVGHRFLSMTSFNLLAALQTNVFRGIFGQYNLTALIVGIFSSLIEFGVIAGIFLGVNYYQQLIKKEQELSKAKLGALIMQLQPHFLFNTLHSISSLIDLDIKGAQRMITRLGQLLRSTLEANQSQFVKLEEEIDYIKDYLEIEQVRFQDRLTVQYEIATETKGAIVPRLILQPLVENAIKHGIAQLTDNGVILVRSALNESGSKLHIEVIDNGKCKQPINGKNKSKGIGLKNVKSRLHELYVDYSFDLEQEQNSGCIATIIIPFKT